MSSEQSHKKRLWRLFLQTSVGICGFGTSRSSGGRSGDTCLALTSGATTNTGVCCFTPRWCSAGTPMLCPCTNTTVPECTVTHPSADEVLHMFTWHRCQPCTANTSPIERGFSDNSLRAHFAAVSPKLLRDCSPAFLDACHPGGWVSEETRKPTGQRRNCILIHSV